MRPFPSNIIWQGRRLLLDCIPEDRAWSDDGEITFPIPEYVAWEIRDLAEEEDFS